MAELSDEQRQEAIKALADLPPQDKMERDIRGLQVIIDMLTEALAADLTPQQALAIERLIDLSKILARMKAASDLAYTIRQSVEKK